MPTDQLADFRRDGFLVLEGFASEAACAQARERAEELVDAFDADAHRTIFTTNDQTRVSDDLFLSSGDRITCFFEEEAFAPDGTLAVPKAQSINKIGHALHDLDPVFERFSYTAELAELATRLGLPDALALQSMYIFKQPGIGGEVGCHQDATFLYTDPISVIGFWFVLEDATLENGCLWAARGAYTGPLRNLFKRAAGGGTEFEELDPTPLPVPPDELEPLPVPAGTLVVLDGRLPHWSDANRSPRSRHVYSLHCISAAAAYPSWNWLQRGPDLPLRGLADGAARVTSAQAAGMIDPEALRRAPKVVLHDHLDGGLRAATVVELAAEHGYTHLPTTDVADLSHWFHRGGKRNDLVLYLETFAHTIAVMQERDAIIRVAAECAEDLAADGVVYAEIRFAPEQHTEAGLTLDEVLDAVLEGFRRGSAGTNLTIYAICSAMRTAARSLEIAELAVRWRDAGVVGFDIAGAEAGYPPTRHLDAFQHVQRENFHATIHAGEAFGLPSIWEAVQWCGAERLGHGVRIVDDIQLVDGEHHLGRLAAYVRDRRIPLELCPTSNLNTGVVDSIADHPIGLLGQLRFRVTVNTDNRLMSDTSVGNELRQLHEAFGWGWDDFEWLTVNAMKSAFAPFDERLRLINGRIKPAYALLKAERVGVSAARI